jgi:hypothetical protein
MEDATPADFIIYPNPTDGLSNISSVSDRSGDATVQVFDLVGGWYWRPGFR